MELYKPYGKDRYPVFVGSGKHAALCTVWNRLKGDSDETGLISAVPGLLAKCAIIGGLYGRDGLAAIIRNLALNPQIRRLYVWNRGEFSRNPFGRSGTDLLRALWTNGIGDDGRIEVTRYRLESEIDPASVRRIVSDVELIFAGPDRTGKSTDDEPGLGIVERDGLMDWIDDSPLPALREAVAFNDPVPVVTNRWPSENVGWLVRERKIIDAWRKVVMLIMRYGLVKGTQYGAMEQRELVGVSWVIDEAPEAFSPPADWSTDLLATTGASPDAIRQYVRQLTTAELGAGSYGARLTAFPAGDTSIDQLEQVIVRNFLDSPDTRRAVATTMNPPVDWGSEQPPCLITVECLQGDAKLHMLATFRSHDIFRAALPNAVALRYLHKRIAARLGFEMGQLKIDSHSAHIYETNWYDATDMVKCAFLEREPALGIPPERYDPAGNMIISIESGTISCALHTPEGAEAWQCEYRDAAHIMARIAQLGLLRDPYHLMYLGHELARAEAALKEGRPFVQS